MGTTIVASLFYDNKLSIAHIGDSRDYRFRDNVLKQVTKDHSFVQELLDKGLLTRGEARVSDKKNVVTRALGVAPYVEVECHDYEAQVDDVYLFSLAVGTKGVQFKAENVTWCTKWVQLVGYNA